MNDNDNDQLKKSTEDSTSKLSGKRRALIKGTAAMIPAVFTLKTGPAFAAENSFNACLVKDADKTPPSIISTSALDGWLRKEVSRQTLNHDTFTVNVYHPDTDAIDKNLTAGWLPEGYNGTSEKVTYNKTINQNGEEEWFANMSFDDDRIFNLVADSHERVYILVRVRPADLEIIGEGANPRPGEDGQYVTHSCWASVPNRPA